MDSRRVIEYVLAIANRSDAESNSLAAALIRTSWPSGVNDRRDPVAIEWLTRWRPHRATFPAVACACSTGTCAVCN